MNPAKLDQFIEAYAEGLRLAIIERPHHYRMMPGDTPDTRAIRTAMTVHELLSTVGMKGIYFSSEGYRNACIALKIDHSERGIANFLEVPYEG